MRGHASFCRVMASLRVWIAVLVGLCVPCGTALAAFPGRSGLLAVEPTAGTGVTLAHTNGTVVARICGLGSACQPPGPVAPRWSPDGRALALSVSDPRVPGPGTVLVYPDGSCLDCDVITGRGTTFTPNPSVISVVSGQQVLTYGIDGIREATQVPNGASAAAWSSTGELALVSHHAVWAGWPGKLRRVGTGGQPSWSPSGLRLAIVRRHWILVLSLRHPRPRRLVRGSSPAWSPDGREIAFIGPRETVQLVRAGGGRPTRAGRLRGRSVDWQPLPRPAPAGCVAPPGSTVVAMGPQGVVTRRGTTAPYSLGGPAAFMACSISAGRERLLVRYGYQDVGEESGVVAAATAGDYAALATFETSVHYGGSRDAVVVYDLRSGLVVPRLGGETLGCDGFSCMTSMDQLAINSQGYTVVHAVITGSCAPTFTPAPQCEEIQVSDSAGTRTLDTSDDSSPTYVLTDLTLAGDAVSWRHAGTPETAQLR